MATLEQLKRHVRVLDEDGHDEELAELLDAARNHLESLDLDMSEPIAPALSHAVVLLAGYWFNNGGSLRGDPAKPPAYGIDRLIAPYRSVCL